MKALVLALLMLSPQAWSAAGDPYCENFTAYTIGTNINTLTNWYSAGSGTFTVQNFATFGGNAARHVASGGWLMSEYRGGWTNTDFQARLSNPYYVTVRQQALTGIFTPGYYIRFNNATSLSYGKICGGNNFDAATIAISVNLSDVTARITMVGLVMTVYLNGVQVATHDFTGNVFCSSAAYASGGIGFQFINATTYIDDIVVNGGSCSGPALPSGWVLINGLVRTY